MGWCELKFYFEQNVTCLDDSRRQHLSKSAIKMGLSQWEGVLIPSKPFSIGAIPLNHSTGCKLVKNRKLLNAHSPIDWKNGKKLEKKNCAHSLTPKNMEKREKKKHSLLT